MEKILKGEVALVTGSGRGLGHAMISRLAELGADVAVHDIRLDAPAEFGEAKDLHEVAEKLTQFGGRATGVIGDVTDQASVKKMVADAEKALGPLTIIVNCAGGDIAAKGGKPEPNDALAVPWEDVLAIFGRNLFGTMLVCRAAVPGMMERGRGSVVNIASGDAHAGTTKSVAYAVAKSGIVHYSRCLAKQTREKGVRVNVVSPGATKTARFQATRKVDPKMMDESHPLIRYGKPEEIADAVAFFAGPQSRFVSGQVLRVCGGVQLFAT